MSIEKALIAKNRKNIGYNKKECVVDIEKWMANVTQEYIENVI